MVQVVRRDVSVAPEASRCRLNQVVSVLWDAVRQPWDSPKMQETPDTKGFLRFLAVGRMNSVRRAVRQESQTP